MVLLNHQIGMFVCSKGIAKGACTGDKNLPNITAQVSFYSLQTSFVSSRKNYTITSITGTTVRNKGFFLRLMYHVPC